MTPTSVLANISSYVHPDGHSQFTRTSLELNAGISCLLGISGSGKTTLLRILVGLAPGRLVGEISLTCNGVSLSPRLARQRGHVGIMFQRNTLVPWFTVERNLTLPNRLNPSLPQASNAALLASLASVCLPGETLNRYPDQLSVGMLQRVAFARVILYRPTVLLLDEPFAGLDSSSADALHDCIAHYTTALSSSICLVVTHDVDRAISLSSVIYHLSDGVIQPILSPSRTHLLDMLAADLTRSVHAT